MIAPVHWTSNQTVSFRAEGALSIVAPENIVENTSVLKKKKMKNFLWPFRELVRVTLTKRFVSDCIDGLPMDK